KHRSRSKSKTSSKERTPSRTPTPLRSDDEEEKKAVVKPEPEPISTPEKSPPFPEKSSFRAISDDDDDLPVGADFRTVMKEAKKKINISTSLPVAPPLGKPRSSQAFPLSKEIKKDLDDDGPMEKRESDVLNKVIAEKGRGDFVPRNLKVKTSATETSSAQSHIKSEAENGNETELKPSIKIEAESLMDISADEAEFGPASLPPPVPAVSSSGAVNSAPAPEPISDGELEKEIFEEINAAAQPKTAVKSRLARVVESSSAVISKGKEAQPTVSAFKEPHSRKRRRSPRKRSSSPNTDEEIRIKARNALRERYHHIVHVDVDETIVVAQGRDLDDAIPNLLAEAQSEINADEDPGRRPKVEAEAEVVAVADIDPVGHDPDRHHEVGVVAEAAAAPQVVVEAGAEVEVAAGHQDVQWEEKVEGKVEALGISLGNLDQLQNQPKSVDDFVSYCQQIQRRQEKETRREKGEPVSSDDDDSDNAGSRTASPTSFKHPFGVKTAGPVEGIKINIVNATNIPTKTPQERILDSSQLRLVYPVSSGVTHKENTASEQFQEREWTPVVKDELKTCSAEQKKYVGITSLEAQKYHSASTSADHLLPPPPAPPVLTGLGGLLPPPPPPPKLTAFDTLLPPPPPLPELLVVPPEEELIIHEPDKIEIAKKRDVAKVLAQRASAQLTLASNPNDFEAIRMLKEADDQMAAWAAAKNLPGKFTGSTGLNVLSSDELQPHDPRYNAWVRKV
ncbi:unnamed protein product, partial [Cylicostephanus goldi]